MISNKDIRIENGNLIINGVKYPLDTIEIREEVDALAETVGDSTSGLVKEVSALTVTVGDETAGLVKDVDDLDDRITTLEGSAVSDFVQIGRTESTVVTTGTFTAGFLKSNINAYSEFMFVAYCEDDSAQVPPPIILKQNHVQRVVDNKNYFSVTNGTIKFSVQPQANVPVNYVNAELTGITTTDKRYYIEFYGRPVSTT